jgi:nitrite reductase (NO-forming)
LAVLTAVVIGVTLPACADDGPADKLAGGTGAAVGAAAAAGEVIEFVTTEFAFAPTSLTLDPGTYRGILRNDGAIEHDIVFGDGTPTVAGAGESVEFEFTVPEGGIEYLCSIPGHADAGMKGLVTTPGASATAAAGDDPASHGGSNTVQIEADPNAQPIEVRDPRAPARGEGDGFTFTAGGAPGGGDLIEVEMVIEEKLMTVAEGYQQMVWTFNGQLPGPVIRTQVGDTVRVHLVNPPEAQLSHSVDFHASQVAWNDEMRSIAPGEELVYEFTTDYAGVWMYHCGTAPVLHHIANGMFGMVIVDPEGGLDPVDHEFFFVQNDWYLGPQGEPSSLEKANVGAPSPDFVMFNGVAAQYVDQPLEVGTGDSVRMFVLDAGPSIDSSFHVVGTIFDTVIKEGLALTRGNDGNWGAQAVDLSPAQGAVIELTTAEDGLYPIVTHAFNFPGRGALGLLKAGDGEP